MIGLASIALAVVLQGKGADWNTNTIWWIFLERTKTPLTVSKEEGEKLQTAHIGNFKRLFGLKKLLCAGPLDDVRGGTKRGIVVLNVGDRNAVQDCFLPDPYVHGKVFDVHAVQMKVQIGRFELAKIDPNGVEENRLVVFTGAHPLSREASEAHWSYLAGVGGLAKPCFGASADGADEIKGVALFRGTRDLQSLLDDDPIVKSGVLKATVYPQWLAKGSLPAL